MMKVFLDTNVVLDYYLNRAGADTAEMIFAMGYGKAYEIYVSALTFSNIAYITRKKFPGEQLYGVLNTLLELADVTAVDRSTVLQSVAVHARDFEDAMQYYSALSIEADYIVTSNIKDFPFSEIPVYEPDVFLEKMERNDIPSPEGTHA